MKRRYLLQIGSIIAGAMSVGGNCDDKQPDGGWCAVPTIPNGVVTDGKQSYLSTEQLHYTCNPGFHALGSPSFCGSQTGEQPFYPTPVCAPDEIPLIVDKLLVVAGPNAGVGNGSVLQFNIATNGTLTPAATPMVAAGPTAQQIAVGPKIGTSRFAYVSNPGLDVMMNGSFSQYAAGADGLLTAQIPATVTTGQQPLALAVSGDGKALIVNSSTSNQLTPFALSAAGAGTAAAPTSLPGAIDVCTIGQNLYASVSSMANAGAVAQFAIAANAALSPLTPATAGADNKGSGIACETTGKFVYVAAAPATGNSQILQFSANGGALTPLSPASVVLDSVFSPQALAVDPTKHHLAALDTIDGTVYMYNIGATGLLTPMTTPTLALDFALGAPSSVAFDPSGSFLYVGQGANIAQFAVGADSLTPLSPASVSAGALDVMDLTAVGQ